MSTEKSDDNITKSGKIELFSVGDTVSADGKDDGNKDIDSEHCFSEDISNDFCDDVVEANHSVGEDIDDEYCAGEYCVGEDINDIGKGGKVSTGQGDGG